MQYVIPRLNAAWHAIAPMSEPDRRLQIKNRILIKNIPDTQSKAGTVKNLHRLLTYTNPKWAMCVMAKAALSIIEAFFSPTDFAKLT